MYISSELKELQVTASKISIIALFTMGWHNNCITYVQKSQKNCIQYTH